MNSITVRAFTSDDLQSFERLHEKFCNFPIPNLDDKLYFQKAVAESDGKVLAFGLNRLTSEAILILDRSLPRTLRTRAIVTLISDMIVGAVSVGIDESHAFVDEGDDLVKLLNRLGYMKTKVAPLFMEF